MREVAKYCKGIPTYEPVHLLIKKPSSVVQETFAPTSVINFANFIHRQLNDPDHPQFEDYDAAVAKLRVDFSGIRVQQVNAPIAER